MNPNLMLRDATVQELQLELIRRTQFNSFDGERVCALLERHRPLWRAVIFDRFGLPNYAKPGPSVLQASGLIKLRDLEHNDWNVDTLFVLTHDTPGAQTLATAFEEADFGAMPNVHEDRDATNSALGTSREDCGLLTVWWD